ncbi:unnamed protein product [Brassica napus]|uniref:(rape) hypothetical protein n=1 Tax=Brassica napus TaxID=3708 RepID=A0A816IW79_BRANA|nr:unnamed protein product [Brassica napus]
MIIVCSVASGLSFGNKAKGVMTTLYFFRFSLGFGIGGDYPLSTTIMSEYANKKTRGAFIAAVFAMQAALTYYWRMKMPETARYTALVAKNIKQATQDMSKVLQVELEMEERAEDIVKDPRLNYGLFSKEFAKRHGLPLLGCTSTWFLLDVAFYSQNLFQKDIFSAIGWIPQAATMNGIHEVFMIARAQTLIALCSTVPGYWFTVAFINIMGRFAIQLMGFFMMTVFMFAIAFPYDHLIKPDNRIGFVVMYSLTFFFANFVPNATTFIVPAEIFPARLRSTCHGISAATGKAGAIVGAFGFLYAAQPQDKTKTDAGYPPGIGVKNSLIMLGVINFVAYHYSRILARKSFFFDHVCRGAIAPVGEAWNAKKEGELMRVNMLLVDERRYGFRELQVVKNNFSSKNQWEKGSYGNVYKGMLGDSMVVAVKSLKNGNVLEGEIQSQSEVELISLAVHCNLLRLYGFCIKQIEKLLVYPYMSNASVESRMKAKPFLIRALEIFLYVLQEGLCIAMSTVIIINRNVKAVNV